MSSKERNSCTFQFTCLVKADKTLLTMININNLFIPAGTLFADMTPKKMAAIKKAIQLGIVIRKRFPEIADYYKVGFSGREIVNHYEVMKLFGVGYAVALAAVYRALGGYDGSPAFSSCPDYYDGLLSPEEMKSCGERNNATTGSVAGKFARDNGTGIFSYTKEEWAEIVRKSVEACGAVIFSQAELTLAQNLAKKQGYKKGTLIKCGLIALELNNQFHDGKPIRTSRSVTKILYRIRSGDINPDFAKMGR